MAKFAVIALCLASMLVASMAAEDIMGFSSARKLQQLTCTNAPRLLSTKNACTTIFVCASPKDSRLKSAAKLFDASCARCLKALGTSPCGKGTAGSTVPKECQQGLSVPAISSCLAAAAGH